MYGGLKKSASRLALVAAAGVLSTGAYAADLGGDCCADLEERVAELEATTARKGNRKVSLTISGQVNRAIVYYNDGARSNTYLGLDNSNSSTRFGFSGDAKISPSVKAGFNILIDIRDKARSVLMTQAREDGSSQERSGNANGDHLMRMRAANWWLEHNQFGRITMGRLTVSGPTGTIDLGGVGVVATAGEGCIGDGLGFRNSTGSLSGTSIDTFSMACANPGAREEGVQWTSPTLAGFTVSASITEAAKIENSAENGIYSPVAAPAPALTVGGPSVGGGSIGRNIGVDLRYAGEFSGVRAAASAGWNRSVGNDDDGAFQLNSDFRQWGVAGSLLHVPTGLFIQAEYIAVKMTAADNTVAGSPLTAVTRDADRWHVQAGIRQNFFGIGATSLYGEYGKHNDFGVLNTVSTAGVSSVTIGGAAMVGDNLRIWGLGVVQNIDAAAMDLYLGYRNYAAEGVTAAGVTSSLNSIDVIAAGARIRF